MYGRFNESQEQMHNAGESLMRMGPEEFFQSLKNLSEARNNPTNNQPVVGSNTMENIPIDAMIKEESDEKYIPRNFENIQNRLYVSAEYLLTNPTVVMNEVKQKMGYIPMAVQKAVPTTIFDFSAPLQQLIAAKPEPRQQQHTHMQASSNHDDSGEKKSRKENAYRWTAERHLKFAIVSLALGIRDCKPKHVMAFYEEAEVDRAVVSSHLQKIRNVIIKQYNLAGLDDVKNWMIPKDVDSDILRQIKEKWQSGDFAGFSSPEIQAFVHAL